MDPVRFLDAQPASASATSASAASAARVRIRRRRRRTRSADMREKRVKSIQQCIDYAVEKGLLSLDKPININSWNDHMYTDIPQQVDCSSCGVYVIKYMQLWNGVFMRETFTQKEECKSDKEKDDEGQGKDSDDVIEIVSWGDETSQGIKGTLSGKKRGRLKKSGHNTKAAPPEASLKISISTRYAMMQRRISNKESEGGILAKYFHFVILLYSHRVKA
ncbi:hypothetical protein EJB05_46779, partial [Eragrostis curvula]